MLPFTVGKSLMSLILLLIGVVDLVYAGNKDVKLMLIGSLTKLLKFELNLRLKLLKEVLSGFEVG